MLTKEGLLGFFPKLTPKRFQNLVTVFGSADQAWTATPSQLEKKLCWQKDLVDAFAAWRKQIDPQAIEEMLIKEEIHVLSFSNPEYPRLLREIADPPPCLFVRGNTIPSAPALAIVGTRSPSAYGIEAVHAIVPELVAHGITIISGLALGIDAHVHRKTLSAAGKTIAVLGSGCDNRSIAPQTNLRLAHDIIAQDGNVISEYAPYTQPTAYTFPRRNRIIAGLSLGTLVIEAGESSGALITASCSLDYNREVFAIPQPIGSLTGKGVNNLIKEGALLVTSAQDILKALPPLSCSEKKNIRNTLPAIALTPVEAQLYEHLSEQPAIIDELAIKTKLASAVIVSTLSLLEIKGVVKHTGGSQFIRIC